MLPLKDENPVHRVPLVTYALIAACIGIYFLWQPSPFGDTVDDVLFNYERAAVPCEVVGGDPLTEDELRATLQVGRSESCGIGSSDSDPGFPDKSVWLAVLTSMFLHGSILHLAGNMLYLWIFGNNIEDHLGHLRYIAFYLLGGVAATLAHVALNIDSTIPLVGASGAIAAVMGAYMVWFPEAPVRTVIVFVFITVVRLRAKWVLGFWFVLQFFTNPNSGVAWAAHVGGFAFGALVALAVRRNRRVRRATWTADYRDVARWDPTGGAGTGWYGGGR